MASLSDVEAALADLINAQLYPNGAPPSAVAHPVKIYAGWPDAQTLDADLAEVSGVPAASHVSVYALPAERNTTRYFTTWEETPAPAATYTLSAAGQVVTVGGVAPSPYVPQNLAIYLDGTPYVVQATTGETAAQVAADLLAAVLDAVPGAVRSGASITFPDYVPIGDLRVGSTGSAFKVVRQQEKQFQISVWTSSPTLRATIADLFDPVLSDTPRMTLADGSIGQLRYRMTREDDFVQKQRIYRRSLIYSVEYATIRTLIAPQLIVPKTDFPNAPVRGSLGTGMLDFEYPDNAVLESL